MENDVPIVCVTNMGGVHNFQGLNPDTIFCTQCGIWAVVNVQAAAGTPERGLTE